MSLTLRTIESFPRGRTTEELLVLAGAAFSHDRRAQVLAELEELLTQGKVTKGRDGRWRARKDWRAPQAGLSEPASSKETSEDLVLTAASATFALQAAISGEEISDAEQGVGPEPSAVLRYWRSALRSDPRGATTQVEDKHGIEWTLISGRGPVTPVDEQFLQITLELDGLAPAFREALIRREGHENALAVGWPISVGRRSGVARLTDQRAELQRDVEALEREVETLNARERRVAELTRDEDRLETRLQSLTERERDTQAALSTAQSTLEGLDRELSNRTSRVEAVAANVADLQRATERLAPTNPCSLRHLELE